MGHLHCDCYGGVSLGRDVGRGRRSVSVAAAAPDPYLVPVKVYTIYITIYIDTAASSASRNIIGLGAISGMRRRRRRRLEVSEDIEEWIEKKKQKDGTS